MMCTRLIISSLLVALIFSACGSWRSLRDSELSGLSYDRPRIRLLLKDGSLIVTQNYYVGTDSIYVVTPRTLFYEGKYKGISREDILAVETLRIDATEIVTVGIAWVASLIVLIKISSGFALPVR